MSDRKQQTEDIEKFDQVEILDGEYNVEKILDKKKFGLVWKYKVKWEGYENEEDITWEPKENLRNVKYLIEEFEAQQGNKEKEKVEKSNLLRNKTKRNNGNLDNNENENDNSNSVTSSGKKGDKNKSEIERNLISNLNDVENKELSLNENLENRESKLELQSINRHSMNSNKEQDIANLDIDFPLKIINAKILNDNDVNINCLIKWKPRIDGTSPHPAWIPSKILKIKCPSILFDFYESRIKFSKKDDENNNKEIKN